MAIMILFAQEVILFQRYLVVFLAIMLNRPSTTLQSCSDALYVCLQGTYWTRRNWNEFKPKIETLAKSVSEYSGYLSKQCAVSKRLHLYTEPADLTKSFDSQGFQELETHLMTLSLYEFMVLETVCPQDP